MDDRQFSELLEHFNLSWQGYRKVRKGVKKRISRHMKELDCKNIKQYLEIISGDPKEKKVCERHLTVSISRFFRDRQLWKILREKTIPWLISKIKGGEDKITFKVWSCGCARGEEPYSFNILWEELKEEKKSGKKKIGCFPKLKIWATDMNPQYLEMAREGDYQYSSLKEVSSELVQKYFNKVAGKNRYFVVPKLKEAITFEKNNILKEPPPSKNFSMVFLRNSLLTYYRSPEKENTLTRIIDTIKVNGVLIVGSHEKIPPGFEFMERSFHSAWIYIKQPVL